MLRGLRILFLILLAPTQQQLISIRWPTQSCVALGVMATYLLGWIISRLRRGLRLLNSKLVLDLLLII